MIYGHLGPRWIFVDDVFELSEIETLAAIVRGIGMESLVSLFFHFEDESAPSAQFIHLVPNILVDHTPQLLPLHCKLDLIMYIFKAFAHPSPAL